jgi:hypothetical protein
MDPYKIKIGGVVADPYRIAIEYGLDPILGQALKKILRCGRKHKSAEEDAKEVITTMERWLEIQRERCHEASIESLRYVPSVERVSTEFPIDNVKEAIAKGSSDERAGLVPVDDAYIVHSRPTYAGPTQEQIAERNRQLGSNAPIIGFVSEEAARRFPYPNPDYVDAKDDTVQVDLSKLSGDELTAAGFPEDGIVREVLKQAGLKTNMEKLLDKRDSETSWP